MHTLFVHTFRDVNLFYNEVWLLAHAFRLLLACSRGINPPLQSMIRLRLLPQDRVSLRPEEIILPLKIEELGRITAEWPSCLRQLHLVEGVCLCERGTLDICRLTHITGD